MRTKDDLFPPNVWQLLLLILHILDSDSSKHFAAAIDNPNITVWNSANNRNPDLKRYEINQTCQIEEKNVTKNNKTNVVTIDPCTNEYERRFMHCNPMTSKCECYRYLDYPHSIPNYKDPVEYNTSRRWFVYDKKAKECVVKEGERCGLLGEVHPYRCEGQGRCVDLSPGDSKSDEYYVFCSACKCGNPRSSNPSIRLIYCILIIQILSCFIFF